MDYPYAHVLEYKSYWFSMSFVFTKKDIMGMSILVFGGNKDHKNGALNVVDFSILFVVWKIGSYQSYLRGILKTSPIWYSVVYFVGILTRFFPNCLYVSDLIEYSYIFLKISPDNILISASCDDMYLGAFSCQLLTWYVF